MTIEHTAFLDLENALSARVRKGFKALLKPLAVKINAALAVKRYAEVDRLIDTLDLTPLIAAHAAFAQTIGAASLLLGASRLIDPKNSSIAKNPPLRELQNVLSQWALTIGRNAAMAIRLAAHLRLAKLEAQDAAAKQVIAKSNPHHDEHGRTADGLTLWGGWYR